MKTILIPTDFSSASQHALQFGLSFLQKGEECKVLLLNTFLVPSSNPHQLVAIHDDLKKKSLTRLEAEANRLKKNMNPQKISVETLSYMGSLENVIDHLARERNVDYVILGANNSPVKDEITKLISRIACPILIVPFKNK